MNSSRRAYARVIHLIFVVLLIVSLLFLDTNYFPFSELGETASFIYSIVVFGYAATGAVWIDGYFREEE